MNTSIQNFKVATVAVFASALLLACAGTPTKPAGSELVRQKLTRLQSDPQLASLAPVAIKEAEAAVVAAEQPRDDKAEEKHLVEIADAKVDTAMAQAQSKRSEDQRKVLSEQREGARLESRTLEADKARDDANAARSEADLARSQADAAKLETDAARQQAADLAKQIADLNAKETERGLIVTLGDVLFATGRSELKGSAPANLAKLSAFLNKYPDRSVIIEGHTDNVGSDDSNFSLSQRRADAVKSYLVSQGVAATRLVATGKGEGSPVAGNDSETGRQQNRRVEVVIANTVTSGK